MKSFLKPELYSGSSQQMDIRDSFHRSESHPALAFLGSESHLNVPKRSNPFKASPSRKKLAKLDQNSLPKCQQNETASLINKLMLDSDEQNANLPSMNVVDSTGPAEPTDFRCLLGLPPLETTGI